jgi:hypothetical protein
MPACDGPQSRVLPHPLPPLPLLLQCTPAAVGAEHSTACGSGGMSSCGATLTSCSKSAGVNGTALCDCRGEYDSCLQDIGCSPTIVDSYVQSYVTSEAR